MCVSACFVCMSVCKRMCMCVCLREVETLAYLDTPREASSDIPLRTRHLHTETKDRRRGGREGRY